MKKSHILFCAIIFLLVTETTFGQDKEGIDEKVRIDKFAMDIYNSFQKSDKAAMFVDAVIFYIFSVLFSLFWSRKFKNGPVETLMRKISG